MYKKVVKGPLIEETVQEVLDLNQHVMLLTDIRSHPKYASAWTGTRTKSTSVEAADLMAGFLSICESKQVTNLCQIETVTGTRPVRGVDLFVDRKRVDWPQFQKSCREGTIASNPYEVSYGVVRSGESWTKTSQSLSRISLSGNTVNILKRYDMVDPWPFRNGITRDIYHGPRSWINDNSTMNSVITATTTLQHHDFPLQSKVMSGFREIINSHKFDMDDVFITNTLAKANDKEIDVLTTLAELPKTVESIYKGVKLLTEMTKAAKGKEIAITKSYERLKKDNAKLAYAKRMNKFNNSKRKHKQDKTSSFDEWYKTNERRFGVDTATEITDAIQGVWMNYRYNIRPLVYTIQDAASAIDKFKNKYITVRGKEIRDIEMPDIDGLVFEGTATVTHRCWIKRRYDVSEVVENMRKVIMADIFVTAYELIPVWSIVADWFFNIGSALRAFQFNTNHIQQQATYSTKIEINGKYVDPSDSLNFNEVEYTGYKRSTIIPTVHLKISYDYNFDTLKAFDALSFAWHEIRKPVNKIKYRT